MKGAHRDQQEADDFVIRHDVNNTTLPKVLEEKHTQGAFSRTLH